MNYSRFRTVFANAVRNLRSLETYCNMSLWTWEMFDRGRFGVGTAIDASPPFVLSFQLFEGVIPSHIDFLSPSGRGEGCGDAV